MRLLFFTDPHIRLTNPRSRTDNFYETLIEKFTEIKNYVDENNIDYVLCGGDLFDRPDTAIKPTSEIGKILNSFSVPIYIIAGNHDLYGNNPVTISRTMLGLLENLEIVKKIPEDGVLLEKDGFSLLLLGDDYTSDVDEGINSYIVKREDLKYNPDKIIKIVHGYLMDKPFYKGVDHTLIGEIKDTDADITLAGHYHFGFKTQVIDGKYFANPGSLVRIKNRVQEITRKPKFIVIDIDKDRTDLKDVYLKSARPGNEVLDRTKLKEEKYREDRLLMFSEEVSQNVDLEYINIDKIILDIAKNDNLEKKVLDEAKLRLDNAKEKLDAED